MDALTLEMHKTQRLERENDGMLEWKHLQVVAVHNGNLHLKKQKKKQQYKNKPNSNTLIMRL